MPEDAYTASVYGSYRTTSDITCALIEGGSDNAFLVALPDGEYTVLLIASDAEEDPPLFEVSADGQKKLDVCIPRRAFVFMEPFRAHATGGRLQIDLKGLHGWILSGLVVGKDGAELAEALEALKRDIFFLTESELPHWKERKSASVNPPLVISTLLDEYYCGESIPWTVNSTSSSGEIKIALLAGERVVAPTVGEGGSGPLSGVFAGHRPNPGIYTLQATATAPQQAPRNRPTAGHHCPRSIWLVTVVLPSRPQQLLDTSAVGRSAIIGKAPGFPNARVSHRSSFPDGLDPLRPETETSVLPGQHQAADHIPARISSP